MQALTDLLEALDQRIDGLPDHPWIPGGADWAGLLEAIERARHANSEDAGIVLDVDEARLAQDGLGWLDNHTADTGPPDYLPTEKHRRIWALSKRLVAFIG